MDLNYSFHPIPFAMSDILSFFFLNILSLFCPTNHTKQAKKLEDLALPFYFYTLAFYAIYQSDLFGQTRNGKQKPATN